MLRFPRRWCTRRHYAHNGRVPSRRLQCVLSQRANSHGSRFSPTGLLQRGNGLAQSLSAVFFIEIAEPQEFVLCGEAIAAQPAFGQRLGRVGIVLLDFGQAEVFCRESMARTVVADSHVDRHDLTSQRRPVRDHNPDALCFLTQLGEQLALWLNANSVRRRGCGTKSLVVAIRNERLRPADCCGWQGLSPCACPASRSHPGSSFKSSRSPRIEAGGAGGPMGNHPVLDQTAEQGQEGSEAVHREPFGSELGQVLAFGFS